MLYTAQTTPLTSAPSTLLGQPKRRLVGPLPFASRGAAPSLRIVELRYKTNCCRL